MESQNRPQATRRAMLGKSPKELSQIAEERDRLKEENAALKAELDELRKPSGPPSMHATNTGGSIDRTPEGRKEGKGPHEKPSQGKQNL